MIGLDLGRLDSNLHLTKDIKNSVLSNNICMKDYIDYNI